MSDFSKNITLETGLNLDKFMERDLKIASSNLDDFNLRFESNIKLKYDGNYFILQPGVDKYAPVFLRYLHHLLAFNNNDEWKEEDFISYDLHLIHYDFQILYNSIKTRQSDFDDKSELNLFISRFDKYHPLDVFSEKGEKEYQSRVQDMVDRLNKVRHLIDE